MDMDTSSAVDNRPRASAESEPDISSRPGSDPPDEAFLESPDLGATTPQSPRLSRNPSYSGSGSHHDDWDPLPPADRLSVLDLLDNFALPQQLEKLQRGISAQTDKVRRSKDALKSKTQLARDRMVEEWRRRAPSADEQLDRYKKRMRRRVDKLGKQWNDTKAVSMREKISFIFGVMNIFISGYLIGGFPEYFHIWYTAQLVYFMPIRFFTYHHQGYHYFLADLCYFANLLLTFSIWGFPNSKRLFMAAYCLSFGNNAVAIIMWRNSLVFHSLDKVTSLFIHIMPCATLHCIVHLLSLEQQHARFPAIWTIKNSNPGSPTAYANVVSMLAWSTIPYAVWQVAYYLLITVRRRDKIAAGRPTSFTWLRRSYSKTWVGHLILSLPNSLQESAFMAIQYSYAVLTMLPCPIWFASRFASSAFLFTLFGWSIYNGSTYYIDVFGKRFQKELEAMKAEVLKWQNTPEPMPQSTVMPRRPEGDLPHTFIGQDVQDSTAAAGTEQNADKPANKGIDHIPLLD
ncbi:hypothetical protein G6O67_003945 [Ophiocordyceps sinensis]|uniref:Glycerophosphocholine acyltransferase 1 n=2 Tax=Ophiocordyceps sinensis TaxID=72228 RepID=A0A8H4V6H8_9HYPO|nr:F-box protein [Ophiocordyceps sinensis CO18]KAF4509808.1 hypothetical protein G6O67_003945 [Ophiocordyceps sinensis]